MWWLACKLPTDCESHIRQAKIVKLGSSINILPLQNSKSFFLWEVISKCCISSRLFTKSFTQFGLFWRRIKCGISFHNNLFIAFSHFFYCKSISLYLKRLSHTMERSKDRIHLFQRLSSEAKPHEKRKITSDRRSRDRKRDLPLTGSPPECL